MATSYSGLRVEVAVRAAMIAKSALEMVGIDPSLVPLHLREVAKQLQELDGAVRAQLAKPDGASR